jgi:hypothetical protein
MLREFQARAALPHRRQFVTLRGAADYIMALPTTEQNLEAWQTATSCLKKMV